MSEVRTPAGGAGGGAATVDAHDVVELEQFRTELTGYAYRMLGSGFEAEDAVQEAMIRGWRGLDRFEGRSALRSWMYRITTNVCLDMLKGRERRALPMDLGPSQKTAEVVLSAPLGEATWIQPIPDGRVLPDTSDPAEAAVQRETVQLAFVSLLQNLPPRQRVVLILREVLQWRASEVAELLDTTVASVNSALQRARATLAVDGTTPDEAIAKATAGAPGAPTDSEGAELLQRYLEAFENYDMEGLVALLHEDATMSMPPLNLWLQGPDEIVAWMEGPGHGCKGSRLVATSANGMPAFAQYRPAPEGGWAPWSLHVLQVVDGRIAGLTMFLDSPAFIKKSTLFPYFGLPARLE
ncbi:sigma-70 family RNA polymerase sigma factor [Kineosporia succinea]|uniref:RNA polymerase sigma-70 factor (ECF subfamily) n=1 Tax=Kineosporia succinea TaxID=84632 RepID=A0ABT9NZ99_9ACTN|nr:sigma-70 family RNA polymerase sigma factor [Kineosporia succinea]MDP9825140.1 RNA polymerase sigma-70 factor (ECF subfamily) [Kineosporia succinea]